MNNTFVVIPAYNAEATLPGVIRRIPEETRGALGAIIIVDDGSADATAEVAARLARKHDTLHVLQLGRNRGYGGAMKTGLTAAADAGAQVVVCLHADGQYAPESLPSLLEARASRGLDILQGSRIAGKSALAGGMPLYKYIAGRGLTCLENLTFGMRMTDYHSGYMIYSRRALTEIPFSALGDSFDFDLQMIACARARGLYIGEWPIPTRYAGEVSHLSPVRYGLRCLGVMLNYKLGKYDRMVRDG